MKTIKCTETFEYTVNIPNNIHYDEAIKLIWKISDCFDGFHSRTTGISDRFIKPENMNKSFEVVEIC